MLALGSTLHGAESKDTRRSRHPKKGVGANSGEGLLELGSGRGALEG